MQSPHGFIVRPVNGKRYQNTKNVGGIDMIVSVSEEDFRYSNRFATVIELPLRYEGDIKIGDTLVVHHNVHKFYFNMKGKRTSGKSFLSDDLFLVEPEQFFMYQNESGWHTIGQNCFVKPIKALESVIKKPNDEEPLMGILKYGNPFLKSKGVVEGDTVFFTPDSEYRFDIDGEKLYRIFNSQIVGKV